ncbi:hypothetical protein BDR03DRAFT_822265, partial [Suillus americanus]
AITAASAPDLFEAGALAITWVVEELQGSGRQISAPIFHWPLIFSGLEIIANRTTLSHQDAGGSPTLFDLLISLGSSHEAKLTLADVGAELDYNPGTMVFISGKVLQHSIGPWGPGERLIIAHFMKDKIHSRVKVSRPTFSMQA